MSKAPEKKTEVAKVSEKTTAKEETQNARESMVMSVGGKGTRQIEESHDVKESEVGGLL